MMKCARTPSARSICWPAAIACFVVGSIGPLEASLSDEELRQISKFEQSPSLRDLPDFARAEMEPRVHEAHREAQALFAGRGRALARHFLTHTGIPPSNSAWYFILEAVGDAEAAMVLIRALWDPPAVESGPPISAGGETWLRDRDRAEIHQAIASVLVNEGVRADPSVLEDLLEALDQLRPARPDLGPGDASRVVEHIGLLSGAHAVAVLQELASDPDPDTRSAALQGLGQVAGRDAQQVEVTTFETVSSALRSDPEPQGRIEAAVALARLDSTEAAETLRDALIAENHPMVVDAIVSALAELEYSWEDPAACGDIVARSWEPSAARALFECWHKAAPQAQLLDTAIEGSGMLRVLALHALVAPALAYRSGPGLSSKVTQLVPTTPPGPPGAKSITAVIEQRPFSPRPVIEFEEPVRARLLASVVDVLSRPSGAIPGPDAAISSSTVWLLHDVLWEIAGREMVIALRHADRIATAGMRYTGQGRYGASNALWRQDSEAYLDYRRPRQAITGVVCAAVFAVLLAWRRTRRAGVALLVVALAWTFWSLFADHVRDLPPPPLHFLTVAAFGFGCAGVAVAALALFAWPNRPRGLGRMLARAAAAAGVAALLAFFASGYTRWYGLFPIGREGWESIFDPLGSAILAFAAAAAVSLLDSAVAWLIAPQRPIRTAESK